MNELNYASLEASKKLFEAGIVLETEAGWYKIFRPGSHAYDWVLSYRGGNGGTFFGDNFPAPCMAEVWRELPDRVYLHKRSFDTEAAFGVNDCIVFNDNPTDALIDLLIRVRKEADHDSDRP